MGSSSSAPSFSPPRPTAGISDFLKQRPFLPKLEDMLYDINRADTAMMERLIPGMLGSAQSYGRAAESMSRGLMPADLQESVMRNAAFSALNTGIGMDSSAGRNLMARDLGLTSMNLMDQSKGFMDAAMKSASFLAPNRMNIGLMSAPALQRRRDEVAAINHQIATQNAMR